jgi:hypothetical protein
MVRQENSIVEIEEMDAEQVIIAKIVKRLVMYRGMKVFRVNINDEHTDLDIVIKELQYLLDFFLKEGKIYE